MFLDQTRFSIQEKFWVKKDSGSQKIWVSKKFAFRNIVVPEIFLVSRNLGLEKIWFAKKIRVPI